MHGVGKLQQLFMVIRANLVQGGLRSVRLMLQEPLKAWYDPRGYKIRPDPRYRSVIRVRRK